jgi:hypothetical protein
MTLEGNFTLQAILVIKLNFRSSYKALEMKEKFNYAFMVLSRAVAPQASYHNKGSILAKILNFDDDVVEYRSWVNKNWEMKVPRIKIIEAPPQPPPQTASNHAGAHSRVPVSRVPDEQSSVGVLSDGESSVLSEELDYLPRRNRAEAYRRSEGTPNRKENRSNSDNSSKTNYEENFPDISESKRAPSEKASSTSYLSDNNNNESDHISNSSNSRSRQKKETSAKSDTNPSESEYDRKMRRERMNRMSAGNGILGMPRIMRSAFAGLGEPDRVKSRNVNINDASSTGSRGAESTAGSTKGKRPTKEFYRPRQRPQQRMHSDRDSPVSK